MAETTQMFAAPAQKTAQFPRKTSLDTQEFRTALRATLAPIMAMEPQSPASSRLGAPHLLDHFVEAMAKVVEGPGKVDVMGLYTKVLGTVAAGGVLTLAERKFAGFMADLLAQNYLRDPANQMSAIAQASMQRLTAIAHPTASA